MSRAKAPRLIPTILRTLFVLLILSVNALLIWRMCSSGDPAAIKVLASNEKLRAAYAEHGDGLILRYQEQASITRAENNAGYFSVTSCVFIPEAEQVQIVFRYNNSTLRHLAEDYELQSIPSKSGVYYDVSLVLTTDLTPADKSDNLDSSTLSEVRISPSSDPVRAETSLYTYFRYTFDGVSIDVLTDGVYVDIYYLGDLDYASAPYGTLCIYAYDSEWLPYTLSAKDKAALK